MKNFQTFSFISISHEKEKKKKTHLGNYIFFFLQNVVEQGYGARLSFWMLSAVLGMSSELGFGPGPPAIPGRVHQAMGLIQSYSFDVSNKGQHLYKEHMDKWMRQASGLEKTSASNILMGLEDLRLEAHKHCWIKDWQPRYSV
ncbi:uncharacterized protein LOC143694464 [Agelaius phoeniceus]|uniref:uncharacterized protein LOC143694464 n=1 Tax=Agelaius phoeniceus TaxID=39638 RepID=UPI004055082F